MTTYTTRAVFIVVFALRTLVDTKPLKVVNVMGYTYSRVSGVAINLKCIKNSHFVMIFFHLGMMFQKQSSTDYTSRLLLGYIHCIFFVKILSP